MAEAVAAATGRCAHCGLAATGGDLYCCFGCELAAELSTEAGRDHARLYGRFALALVLSMVVMMLALFLYPEDVYGAAGDTELAWLRAAYRWASFVLATAVLALTLPPLLRRAVRRALRGRASSEGLVSAGVLAAYGLSAANVLRGRSAIYFDSAAAAVCLATLGRYLEATARSRAARVLTPGFATPRSVRVQRGAEIVELAAAEVIEGMEVIVAPETVVPVDLCLTSDRAELDLAVLTGESRPETRVRGDLVPAGAVALGDAFAGRALRNLRASTLEQLGDMARSLRDGRSGLARLADRLAAVLTPLVSAAALATLFYWSTRGRLETGVLSALAVVLVACPCTYAVATPLVSWLAMRRALGRGVLIRSPEALEGMASVRRVAFDKTGTLTERRLTVVDQVFRGSQDEVLGLIAALEAPSQHPVGRALALLATGVAPARLRQRRYAPTLGLSAVDDVGRAVRLGPPRPSRIEGPERTGPASANVISLERDGEELGRFWLAEEMRADAPVAVASLRAQGLEVEMLTGDSAGAARPIATVLGVPARSGLSPADKVARLSADTAMVGDGLNDAPALAGAAVGIALGSSAAMARGVAPVTLVADDLTLLPWALGLARRSMRTARLLLIGSTLYNMVFVAMAAAGLLRPILAGLSMLIASLLALGVAAANGGGEAEAPC